MMLEPLKVNPYAVPPEGYPRSPAAWPFELALIEWLQEAGIHSFHLYLQLEGEYHGKFRLKVPVWWKAWGIGTLLLLVMIAGTGSVVEGEFDRSNWLHWFRVVNLINTTTWALAAIGGWLLQLLGFVLQYHSVEVSVPPAGATHEPFLELFHPDSTAFEEGPAGSLQGWILDPSAVDRKRKLLHNEIAEKEAKEAAKEAAEAGRKRELEARKARAEEEANRAHAEAAAKLERAHQKAAEALRKAGGMPGGQLSVVGEEGRLSEVSGGHLSPVDTAQG